MKLKFILLFCFITCHVMLASAEFYEIKIYSIETKEQETRMDNYLQNAYIPAAHKLGIKTIGVFKPVATDTQSSGKLIYVLTPLASLDALLNLPKQLNRDADYVSAASDYTEADYKSAPYTRFESIVLEAFEDAPLLKSSKLTGPKSKRVYELRSYESQTEKIHQNKVKMFNAGGEVVLFDQLGFNAVFYGAVVSGAHMPNLMYMTTFADMAARDEHWKAFTTSPIWKKLSAEAEYQNNVSKNTSFFLYPTDYSDL